jgi:hypothetical protein
LQVLHELLTMLQSKLVVVLCGDIRQLPAVTQCPHQLPDGRQSSYCFSVPGWGARNVVYHVLRRWVRGAQAMAPDAQVHRPWSAL